MMQMYRCLNCGNETEMDPRNSLDVRYILQRKCLGCGKKADHFAVEEYRKMPDQKVVDNPR